MVLQTSTYLYLKDTDSAVEMQPGGPPWHDLKMESWGKEGGGFSEHNLRGGEWRHLGDPRPKYLRMTVLP